MAEEKESVSTAELARQLSAINARLDKRSKEQHEANGELQKTLLKFGNETITSSDQIAALRHSIAPFAELKDDAKQIKRVLFGDEKMKEKGLVQRFDEVDTVVKKALIEQRAFFAIVGVIAAVVVFAKGSGILKWLTGA